MSLQTTIVGSSYFASFLRAEADGHYYFSLEIRQSSILYSGSLVPYGKWLIDQVSDVLSIIFFFIISYRHRALKSIFIFFGFIKKNHTIFAKNFGRNYEKSYLQYQTLGRWVICPSNLATQQPWVLYCRLSDSRAWKRGKEMEKINQAEDSSLRKIRPLRLH